MLRVINTIILSINSARTKPKILLKPPVEVRAELSVRILSPLLLEQTYLGKKITCETQLTLLMYLRSKGEEELHRVLETTVTTLLIAEPDQDIQAYIDKPPNEIPENLRKQIIAVTTLRAYPLLIYLCDKHLLPPPLPLPPIEARS